jgi:hypothetical protein
VRRSRRAEVILASPNTAENLQVRSGDLCNTGGGSEPPVVRKNVDAALRAL